MATVSASSSRVLAWRPTKIMNMRDLSKDDDFLSHLLVEKLGTGAVPLLVHKMDSSRRLPKTDAQDLLQIVRRLVATKGPVQHVTRQAVDELLKLQAIRYYLKLYTQKQINAFATHASRYFELYHPSGSIEIAHTSRYSHRTGKSELCILATRFLGPGTVITELKGSMANLTDEEDKELKRTDLRNSDIRRDFSVIHSKQMKKNHLFLGPARFVNHDCDNNCELFREGKYITFRVLRPIAIGEEITAHYGDGYFGRKNRHCLCETCEKKGRGGYALDHTDDPQPSSDSNSDSDSDSDSQSSSSESETEDEGRNEKPPDLNERRTRRGVYAIMRKKEDDSDESENEEDNKVPLADAKDIPGDTEIELTVEADTASELTSLAPSRAPSDSVYGPSSPRSLITPAPDAGPSRSSSSLSSISSAGDLLSTPQSIPSNPFRSIISTRRQKAREAVASLNQDSTSPQQLVTPPLSEDTTSVTAETLTTPVKRVTRSVSSILSSATRNKGKGKEKEKEKSQESAPASGKSQKAAGKDDVIVKTEDAEPRVLRTRPPLTAHASEVAKEALSERVIPRGPDGKLLPICSTCSNVLPVISVDSKVVWGHGPEISTKKKKKKQDCPRCIRHFAIYEQPWPCRVAPHGSGSAFLPTPREEVTPVETITRRVTQKALPVLDNKLAAAASASAKSRKSEPSNDERPAKRRKTEPAPSTEKPTKPKKDKEKDKDKEKEKEKALPNNGQSQSQAISAPPTVRVEGEKRKRGRPRLSSPRRAIKVVSSQPRRSSKPQPRNSNGRFERKDRDSPPKPVENEALPDQVPPSRAERAVERGRKSGQEHKPEDTDEARESTNAQPASFNRKRANEDEGGKSEQPRKKVHIGGTKSLKDCEDLGHKVFPRPASSFRGGKLFSNPNPLSFAVQAWAGMHFDESSSEDEKPPVTPEDDLSPAAVDAGESSTVASSLYLPLSASPRGALTLKPSPFAFARRRWASVSASPGRDDEPENEAGEHINTNSISHSHRRSGRSFSNSHGGARWSKGDVAMYDEEDFTNVSGVSTNGLSSVSSGRPSTFSSNEGVPGRLQHVYPMLSIDAAYIHKATSFSSNQSGPPPTFIHAGWDSCSDISDR